MIRTRPLIAGAAALLSLGIGAPFALASTEHGPTRSLNAVIPSLAPTVVEAPASFAVSLPTVGGLTFTVDPATGIVSNALATALPASGFIAGTPFVAPKFVAVRFTSTTGASRILITQIHLVNGSVVVTTNNNRAIFQRVENNRNDDRIGDNDRRPTTPAGTSGPSGVTGPTGTSSTTGSNAPKSSSTQQSSSGGGSSNGSSGGNGSSSGGSNSNGGRSGKG